jgi:hypothetical protein
MVDTDRPKAISKISNKIRTNFFSVRTFVSTLQDVTRKQLRFCVYPQNTHNTSKEKYAHCPWTLQAQFRGPYAAFLQCAEELLCITRGYNLDGRILQADRYKANIYYDFV